MPPWPSSKRVEPDCVYSFAEPVTKIATLIVGSDYVGSRCGELLLKSIFASAHDRGASSMYVEVLAKHDGLVELLANFGFDDTGERTIRGELVMVKSLRPGPGVEQLHALDHQVRHGPPAIAGTGKVFVIPIWPDSGMPNCFPDAPAEPQPVIQQLELLPAPELGTHPWGNALRKAYLSNSRIRQLAPGDTVLFYKSRGAGFVDAVGVVEETLRSTDAGEVLSFVGRRTVYTPDEIYATMCERVGGVLAVLFGRIASWSHHGPSANSKQTASSQLGHSRSRKSAKGAFGGCTTSWPSSPYGDSPRIWCMILYWTQGCRIQ